MSAEGIEYLEDHLQKYWDTIEEAKSFVPLNFLPPFLRSTREFTILDCKDGYVVFGYPSEGDMTVKSYRTTRRASDVFNTQGVYDASGRKLRRVGPFLGIGGRASAHISDVQFVMGQDKVVYRPRWTYAYVVVGQEPMEVGVDPVAAAKRDIQTLLLARTLGVEAATSQEAPSKTRDVAGQATDVSKTNELVVERLETLLSAFHSMLEDASKEAEAQEFLTENIFILSPTSQKEDVHPKYELGKEYVTDFVIENRTPDPFTHTLVEIEPPTERLFLETKGRETELTQRANHAIDQVMNWRMWIRANIAYMRNDFPAIDQCAYWVIIGRGKNLSEPQRRKLNEVNSEHAWRKIYTYDDLASGLENLIKSLRSLS